MRIAYLTQVNLFSDSGVRTKHIMQAAMWENLGHEVCFFSIPNKVTYDNPIPFPLQIKQYDGKISYLLRKIPIVAPFTRKITSASQVISDLESFKPDIVYMRSMLYYPGLMKLLRKFAVVMEGNTLYKNELKASGNFFNKWINSFGEPRICSKLSGIIGVTDEITKYYLSFNRFIPHITIGNGYSFDYIESYTRCPPQNIKAQIIFVGSPGNIWHGVDHFIEIAEQLPEFDFHLVGPHIKSSAQPSNLQHHGFLQKVDLYKLYEKMDIAVGSLALYRNSMYEGSTLKVKEYAAFGIPIILNHKDVDLKGQDFVLELPSTPNFVTNNIQKIRAFVLQWKGNRVSLDTVRELIDYKKKEAERVRFFEKVINSNVQTDTDVNEH